MSVNPVMNCRKCSVILFFLLFFQSLAAQKPFSGVEAILKQYQKSMGKEVVVMVNKDGKNLYTYQSPAFNAKMQAPIENTSKWLTAAVVMIFVDEGKIKLDDPVSKYIPLFSNYFKGYITIRHCLSHTSGVEAEAAGVLRLAQKSKFANLEEEVKNYVMKREIVNNPGEAFHYSQVGPNIAARVIEIVSRKTFDRVALEKLFRPAGMRGTTFYSESGAFNPSYGAKSTAQDLMNFMTLILNKGMFNGKRILSEASVAEMQKAQFPGLPVKSTLNICTGMPYGLGNWLQETDAAGNATVVGSPGLNGTWPWIDLKKGYAVVVFPEKDVPDMKRTIYDAIRTEIDAEIK